MCKRILALSTKEDMAAFIMVYIKTCTPHMHTRAWVNVSMLIEWERLLEMFDIRSIRD